MFKDYKFTGKRIIVDHIKYEEAKTASGIILNEKEHPNFLGIIVAKGEEVSLSVGTEVMFHFYDARDITLFGKDYLLIDEDKILAYKK